MKESLDTLLQIQAAQLAVLSLEDKNAIDAIYRYVTKKQSQYDKLEGYLDQDLTLEKLNSTHSNLNNIEKDINSKIEQCRLIIAKSKGDTGHSADDEIVQKALSFSRQGAVVIRPTKTGNYKAPATRQVKK
ncbi:hypothetical protein [Dyadobacter sp. LHD-138]|uniref:hypothetical protein n=1 Tax=Dyadobacter sp. LHD-138 TaxID=3071413 RepID=UPI0027E096D4|nr:hypothetical protein [Dyadobacter sp. LHD-138]MDQ6477268.1 hypothetical protein [Dyadobacter sp. LHD-138]